MQSRLFQTALVDGLTQSAKTWKAFELIDKNIQENKKEKQENAQQIVIFITQANSTTAANQIISRAKNTNELATTFHYIGHINQMINIKDVKLFTDIMIVEFWNTKNTKKIQEFVKTKQWKNIIIVIDEIDQGYKNGLKMRLEFIHQIEHSTQAHINVIFITASVPNLSKSICQIAKQFPEKFKSGIVHDIIYKQCVSHHFVKPKNEYIGPSWFVNENNDMWKQLITRPKKQEESKNDYKKYKNECMYTQLANIPLSHKELCLIVSTSHIEEQNKMKNELFQAGFNVIVHLNSKHNKNYQVYYISNQTKENVWNIPYSEIENMADKSKLNYYENIQTNIESRYDISLPYMLQSALFMGTNIEKRIQNNIDKEEFTKLLVLNHAITHKNRPINYPKHPHVALIAGQLAGRGVTIQNAFIDFACTAFCFMGTKDKIQRGAQNAQKFGRACGMLSEIFIEKKRRPYLIASPDIIFDAYMNEICLLEKADTLPENQSISLKQLIGKNDWKRLSNKSNKLLQKKSKQEENTINTKKNYIRQGNIYQKILSVMFAYPQGISVKDFKNIDPEIYQTINKCHRNQINVLQHKFKFIDKIGTKYVINDNGKQNILHKNKKTL